MMDVARHFEKLSLETHRLIHTFLEDQDKATSWIHKYVQRAKDVVNQNSFIQSNAIAETPKRSSRGSLPKPVRVLSNAGGITIVLTPPPSTPTRNKSRSTRSQARRSFTDDVDSCHLEEKDDVEMSTQQLPEQNANYLCVEEIENKCDRTYFLSPPIKTLPKGTPNSMKGSAKKSVKSARSNPPRSSHKVLASTKSSKHRNSLNRSVVSSCSKPIVAKQRVLRQTREKQEHEEALAKKQALLKMRVEEQKRKREIKMEKNLRARQQIEQQTEERLKLKKMSTLHHKESVANSAKDTKRKNTQKNKKRKQTDCSDSEKQSSVPATKLIKILPSKPIAPVAPVARIDPASTKKPSINPGISKTDTGSGFKMNLASGKKIEIAASTPTIISLSKETNVSGSHSKTLSVKAVTPQKPTSDKKAMNSTYVAENNENCESYPMTPCAQEMSYTNYDMSDLRPSDDDDDDVDPSKPMPSWAVGIRLKEALIKQYFHPPDLSKLFPSIEIAADEAFGMGKKKVHRTSSANWTSTPLRIQ